jgi:hypothetical protein
MGEGNVKLHTFLTLVLNIGVITFMLLTTSLLKKEHHISTEQEAMSPKSQP